MNLEELAAEVRAIKLEQIMDAAIIGALLRTHPNPKALHDTWLQMGFASDDFQGEELATFKLRYDHWMEQIVAAEKGGAG